jgi:CrcB protein
MDRLDPLLVAVGGFVGATLRWTVGSVAAGAPGTLVVNVVGSLCLGVVVASVPRRRRTQVFVGTGVLSSFTTYSTFAVDTVGLGLPGGTVNVAATYGLGVTAAVVGLVVGRRLRGEAR